MDNVPTPHCFYCKRKTGFDNRKPMHLHRCLSNGRQLNAMQGYCRVCEGLVSTFVKAPNEYKTGEDPPLEKKRVYDRSVKGVVFKEMARVPDLDEGNMTLTRRQRSQRNIERSRIRTNRRNARGRNRRTVNRPIDDDFMEQLMEGIPGTPQGGRTSRGGRQRTASQALRELQTMAAEDELDAAVNDAIANSNQRGGQMLVNDEDLDELISQERRGSRQSRRGRRRTPSQNLRELQAMAVRDRLGEPTDDEINAIVDRQYPRGKRGGRASETGSRRRNSNIAPVSPPGDTNRRAPNRARYSR